MSGVSIDCVGTANTYFVVVATVYLANGTKTSTLAAILTNARAISFCHVMITLFDHAVTKIVGHALTFVDAGSESIEIADAMMLASVFRCYVMQTTMLSVATIVLAVVMIAVMMRACMMLFPCMVQSDVLMVMQFVAFSAVSDENKRPVIVNRIVVERFA